MFADWHGMESELSKTAAAGSAPRRNHTLK